MSASTSGNLDITPTLWCQPLHQVTLYITLAPWCQPLPQVTLYITPTPWCQPLPQVTLDITPTPWCQPLPQITLYITPTPWCQPLPQVTLYITPTHSCQPLAQVTLCHTLILTSTSVYFIGSGLWCLTPLSTIFHLFRGGQSYWWRKQGYSVKIHWLAVSHRQTLLHNVVLSTPRLNRIRTHNVDDDRHWLQLPYDHDHDGPWSKLYISYPDVNICLW
jgi:hypothetical protein